MPVTCMQAPTSTPCLVAADNGVGVATALALLALDPSEAVHPPLEALFTVEEEIGLLGAAGERRVGGEYWEGGYIGRGILRCLLGRGQLDVSWVWTSAPAWAELMPQNA
jgi:di/tripeptidase